MLVIVTSFYTLKTPRLESYNAKDPGHKSCQDRLIKLYRHLLESQNSECILYGWGELLYASLSCLFHVHCLAMQKPILRMQIHYSAEI